MLKQTSRAWVYHRYLSIESERGKLISLLPLTIGKPIALLGWIYRISLSCSFSPMIMWLCEIARLLPRSVGSWWQLWCKWRLNFYGRLSRGCKIGTNLIGAEPWGSQSALSSFYLHCKQWFRAQKGGTNNIFAVSGPTEHCSIFHFPPPFVRSFSVTGVI